VWSTAEAPDRGAAGGFVARATCLVTACRAVVSCGALLGATLFGGSVADAAGVGDPPALGLVPAESIRRIVGVTADVLPGADDRPDRASWAASVPPLGVLVEQASLPGAVRPSRHPAAPEPPAEIVLVGAERDGAEDGDAAGDGDTDGDGAAARLDVETVSQTTPGPRGAAGRDDRDRGKAKNPCGDQAAECREALQQLRDDDIAGVGLDIRVGGRPGSDYPCECRLEGETYKPRRFATTTFTWKAAGYCHKPLYFEDWMLERYGHSRGCLDPVFSGAHFFVTLTVLPYKMGVELPWECVYPLGYYRPGNCAPWTVAAVPISGRGFAVQAATVTGAVFLLP